MENAQPNGLYVHHVPPLAQQYQPKNVNVPERIVSAIVGAGMVVCGFFRRGPMAAALATVGGVLLERGASGRCAVYSAFHISSV